MTFASHRIWLKTRARPGSALLLILALGLFAPPGLGHGADDGGAGNGVDAVTSASVDATTGASKQVEAIKVTGTFSVAYAVNDDGALFVMARDLADAYQRDELASDTLFKGKAVLVKGRVEKTSKADAAKPWLTLAEDDASGKKVRCALQAGQLSAKAIEPGNTVQVKGTCEGMKLNVSITEGVIIE